MNLHYVSLMRLPTDRAHGYAVMKMCEQFAASGASVELVVPGRSFGIDSDPFAYYGVLPLFLVRKMRVADLSGRVEGSRLAFAVDAAMFIFRIMLRTFNDVMIYTRDYQIALFVRARRVTLEIHTIPDRTFLFLLATHRAERLVVISQGLKEALIAIGIPAKKILVAPDCADLAEFDALPQREDWRSFSVEPSRRIALYTGHFYGWKGGETFAESARHLPQGVEVVLMGGVDRELADFKKRYTGNNVHIIGFQPRGKIPALMKSADVLVLPNSARPKISSHYTSPLKLFQYMASGVPIVASDLPSIREILTDETAYWFTPDDPLSLAKAIEHALSHPEEARQKAARAKEEVKKYTWDARAKTILAFIQRGS